MNLIEVTNVTKTFRRARRKLLRDFFSSDRESEFHALTDVSFAIAEGEGVAIVGSNGAGKSTLLSLIAGLAKPDKGSVNVTGRIAALLELGSGFHPDLTGRENAVLNAALLGFQEKQIRERLPAIIEFAELGEFIDEPIRTFSTGMVVRLAFSVAVHIDPAILIVDEVLGVGDSHFQEKCVAAIQSFRRNGRTMLSVSHNPASVLAFSDRAIWLDHGRVVMDGTALSVMNAYAAFVANPAEDLPDAHSVTLA